MVLQDARGAGLAAVAVSFGSRFSETTYGTKQVALETEKTTPPLFLIFILYWSRVD